ncbi:hypothetical protein QAD02_000670 [Eretmocerus hayati]|uniref:Uncharacterized protein n=1 Tax=Eretmocerus hayati TaxID=131215 RepID=A0ACC2NE93_9HYME|nr:hypothetical protein QAD02_000670 [Eretmocerus hayati]
MMCIVGTSHRNGLPLVPEVGLGYRSEFDKIEYDSVASIAEEIEIRSKDEGAMVSDHTGRNEKAAGKTKSNDPRPNFTPATKNEKLLEIFHSLQDMDGLLQETRQAYKRAREIRSESLKKSTSILRRCCREIYQRMNEY